jgi:hypothetical protein
MTPTRLSAVTRRPFRSYAQNLEDIVLWRALGHVAGGRAGADVHWMKIDVEGMEAAVLRGWRAFIEPPAPPPHVCARIARRLSGIAGRFACYRQQ